MNTCETCKFWSSNWRMPPEERGLVGWNWCDMMQNDYDKLSPYPESMAVAEDSEDYHAGVRTFKDFGCNQWKLNTESHSGSL